MSRKRRDLKVIMRGYEVQRPASSTEEQKNIKAGLKKFFGKSEERPRSMDIHYWWCGNCGGSYLTKPVRCVNADAKHPGGYPFNCDKYPMNENTILNVTGYREYCTDITIGLVKADGTCEDINFQGEDAWDRRESFMKLIGRKA